MAHEPSQLLQAGSSQADDATKSWINPKARWMKAAVALSASIHHNQGPHRCL
ncbi:hypothetical protein SynBIOSE41_02783 [Synechococcus sp. BIOS-E4-1]|nr:hypothetical protein SynBIOSE41_02783 [Synechococcus sp. BIOS-E4-1]